MNVAFVTSKATFAAVPVPAAVSVIVSVPVTARITLLLEEVPK